MTYGLQLYNSSGQLIVDLSTRWSKIVATGTISFISGDSTSATSQTTGTGAKSFILATGTTGTFPTNSYVRIISTNSSDRMDGTVTSYNTTSRRLVINSISSIGSNTRTSWDVWPYVVVPVTGLANNDTWGVLVTFNRGQIAKEITTNEFKIINGVQTRNIVANDALTYWVLNQ